MYRGGFGTKGQFVFERLVAHWANKPRKLATKPDTFAPIQVLLDFQLKLWGATLVH
jgi:hypothetical protein